MNRILIMRGGTWLASRLEAPSYRGTASSGAYEVFCLFQLGGVHIFLERRGEMLYFNFSLWAFFTFVGQTCIPCNMHKLGFMKSIDLGKTTTISIWIWWRGCCLQIQCCVFYLSLYKRLDMSRCCLGLERITNSLWLGLWVNLLSNSTEAKKWWKYEK